MSTYILDSNVIGYTCISHLHTLRKHDSDEDVCSSFSH